MVVKGDVEQASASIIVRKIERGSHEFAVNNYSVQKGIGVGKAMESEEFTVGGYRWKICFYPEGKSVEAYDAGDVSLFVSLESETTTDVLCTYDLCVVDQSGKGKHHGILLLTYDYGPRSFGSRDISRHLHFMNRESLESSPHYLKDDCLKITCAMEVHISHTHAMPIIKVPKSTGPDLSKLLESKFRTDVLFRVENEKFWAHKSILAARSPVFRLIISNCHQSKEIVIPDMESRVFKAMLWYIYSGSLPLEEQETISDSGRFILDSFIAKMLVAAHRFELRRLKGLCQSCLLKRISEETVAYLLYLADLCYATELKVGCLTYATNNLDAVIRSDGCQYLKKARPLLFLELAGSEENPSFDELGAIDICAKILSVAKESILRVFYPQGASYKKSKEA